MKKILITIAILGFTTLTAKTFNIVLEAIQIQQAQIEALEKKLTLLGVKVKWVWSDEYDQYCKLEYDPSSRYPYSYDCNNNHTDIDDVLPMTVFHSNLELILDEK